MPGNDSQKSRMSCKLDVQGISTPIRINGKLQHPVKKDPILHEIYVDLINRDEFFKERFECGEWTYAELICEDCIIKTFVEGRFIPVVIDYSEFIKKYGKSLFTQPLKKNERFCIQGHFRKSVDL